MRDEWVIHLVEPGAFRTCRHVIARCGEIVPRGHGKDAERVTCRLCLDLDADDQRHLATLQAATDDSRRV